MATENFAPYISVLKAWLLLAKVWFANSIDADADALAHEPRIAESEIEASGILAVGDRGFGGVAGAEDIGIADRDLGQHAGRRGVAAGDEEIAGLLLLQRDVEHDAVRRRARLLGDFDGLEIAQRLEAALAAIDQRRVIGVAFAEIEFAPDHVVAGPGIAVDVDALDVKAFALLDRVDQIDQLARLPFAAGHHGRERLAGFGQRHRHILDGFVDRIGVINIAGLRVHSIPHCRRINGVHDRFDLDLAEPILRTFVELECQHDAFLGCVVACRG